MPTLTSLCSSCHSRPPQYKCPRCGTRTCSLACAKVHKARTLCSGVRDAAAYHSRAELNTAAAFDRDFNFISGVERGIERAARESEARGIDVDKNAFSQFDTGRGGNGFRGRGGMGHRGSARGGQRGGRGGRGGGGGGLAGQRPARGEVPLLKSLQRDNVTVLRAPKGMTRQRENRTHWRRKGGGVSWTVEWVEIDTGSRGGGEGEGTLVLRNRRTTQLYEQLMPREGFLAWRTAVMHVSPGTKRSAGGEEKSRQPRSEGQANGQDGGSTQDETKQHDTDADDEASAKNPVQDEWVLALEEVGQQRDHATRMLLPFGTGVKVRLKDLLMGRTIREFPTIYAWRQRNRDQSGEGEKAGEVEEAPGPGFSMLRSFEPPEVPVSSEDKEHDSQTQKEQGNVTNKIEDGSAEPAKEIAEGDDAGDGVEIHDDGNGLDDDDAEHEDADANDEDDDGEDADADELSQTGQPQLEMNVQVAADSNLGISGAIAAALMADMGHEGADGQGG